MTNLEKESLLPLIKSFRERANKLRRNAFINLVIIIAVLFLGVGIFIFAGTLASKESNQVIAREKRARLDYLQARQVDLRVQIDGVQKEIEDTRNRLMMEAGGQGQSGVAGEGMVFSLIREKLAVLENQAKSLLSELSKVQQQEDGLRSEIAQAEADSGRLTLDQNQIWVLVSAIATRVGSIILLLFLVKILVPLYRYNIKLASYYDARADALELMLIGIGEDKITGNLDRLTSALTPENIDFGAPPASPSDQAIELAKHIIDAQKTK